MSELPSRLLQLFNKDLVHVCINGPEPHTELVVRTHGTNEVLDGIEDDIEKLAVHETFE